MKNLILKWLGIYDKIILYRHEIMDLMTTIDTMKDKLTDMSEKYETVYLLMQGIGTEDVDGKPWWEKRTHFEDIETHMLVTSIKRSAQLRWVREHPSVKKKEVFHGECLGCIVPERDGVGKCLKCSYTGGSTESLREDNEDH